MATEFLSCAATFLFFTESNLLSLMVVNLMVLKNVSSSPVGIGTALYKTTSFGSGPCLNDKIRLPSLQLLMCRHLPAITTAAFASQAFADSRAYIPCVVTEREALTMIAAVRDRERSYLPQMPTDAFREVQHVPQNGSVHCNLMLCKISDGFHHCNQ